MATYVLIHGAGSDAWYWHLVAPQLKALGHDVVAPDLPCADDSAGLADYTGTVLDAIGERTGLIVVAQSLGGFVAPLVCAHLPVDLVVLVAAMVPAPGESAGDWWANTGWEQAKRESDERDGRPVDGEFDPLVTFLHDVPAQVVAESAAHAAPQSDTVFQQQLPFGEWPDVRTKFLLCRQDRFFPAEFMRRVVKDRLGITPDEMDSGHLPALAHPAELVAWLELYRAELGRP